jgi:hypothetical protein
LLKDGDVGVGVFPEREEVLIGVFGLGAIALDRTGACEAEMGERPGGFVGCWLAEGNSIEISVNGLAGKSVNIRRSAGSYVG